MCGRARLSTDFSEIKLIFNHGALGRQWVEREDGSHEMTGTDQTELAVGDVFVIETPGGGGYGLQSG